MVGLQAEEEEEASPPWVHTGGVRLPRIYQRVRGALFMSMCSQCHRASQMEWHQALCSTDGKGTRSTKGQFSYHHYPHH